MALQSTAGLAFLLQNNFLQSILNNSLSSFRQAENTLTTERFNYSRELLDSALSRRINTLEATSSAAQIVKSNIDIGTESLNSVSDQLANLASLAGTAATESDASVRASYQSQAETIIQSIASTLSSAVADDPNLLIRTTLPGSTIRNIVIDSTDDSIDSDGLSASIDLTDAGSRATITQAIQTDQGASAAGVFGNNLQFSISGPDGTATISVSSGDTAADAIAAINAVSDVTGVEAYQNTGDVDDIDIRAIKAGDGTITITELTTDPDGEINATTATGTNAQGTLTIDGVSETVEGDGRTIDFDLNGISGRIEVITDFDVIADSANPASASFTIYNGGQPILGDNGDLLGRTAITAFDFSTLGLTEGGLDQIDLVNDAAGALNIIDDAQADVDDSITTAEFLSNNILSEQVTNRSDGVANAQISLTELDSFFEALDLFEQVAAEAQLNTSLALIAQLSLLFPVTGLAGSN